MEAEREAESAKSASIERNHSPLECAFRPSCSPLSLLAATRRGEIEHTLEKEWRGGERSRDE